MKTYTALAQAFAKEDIGSCFALLGDANMHWAGALADQGVNMIYTRHEHAAVAGAAALARSTGRVGCATVTCGPGLTQVLTILPIAVRARLPLVVFAGEPPANKPWYNQGIEHAPFVRACGALYRSLRDPATMLDGIHDAFLTAKRDRVPVVIGVPFDLQNEPWTGPDFSKPSHDLYKPAPPVAPSADKISEAAEWISKSERPIVLAGLGAVAAGASDDCVVLAERIGALLATTLPAKGLFWDQDFSLGVAGGFATEASKGIFAQADLVIGIGTRLASHAFDGGKLTPNARVIHIDINPREMVQGRKASDLQIACDAKAGARALINATSQQTVWRTDAMQKATRAALELPNDTQTPDGYLHPMAAIKALADAIPPDCHIINTSGHSAYYAAQMSKHPQSHFTVIRDFGAIGNGTSFALGIAAAHPERSVVLIDGDGSALMHIQELETFKRHGLHILTVVLNDGAYGSEVHKLRADGVSDTGSVFGRPDFAGIGRGFGLTGETFTDLGGMTEAFDHFRTSKAPAIWDIHISDQIASPQILKAHKAAHA